MNTSQLLDLHITIGSAEKSHSRKWLSIISATLSEPILKVIDIASEASCFAQRRWDLGSSCALGLIA